MSETHWAARQRQTHWLMLLCLALLLAGCASPVRLMPTPVSFRSGEVDPFVQAGTSAQGTDVPVLYVTNRGAVIEKPEPIYTILPSERLRMGVAHVRIGDESLDWETLHRLSTSDDPDDRPIVQLDWLEPMVSLGPNDRVPDSVDAMAFLALVDKALAASASRHLLIYVHGSNNTMARAAAKAAQLRHFTGRRVVVLAFLWPSGGSILRYFTDVVNAAASVDSFVRLIELLVEHTQAANIDVLAYSAGAQITSPATWGLPGSREPRDDRRQPERQGAARGQPDTPRIARRPTRPDRTRCRADGVHDRSLDQAGLRPDQGEPGRHPQVAKDLACVLVRGPLGQRRPARLDAAEGSAGTSWPGRAERARSVSLLDLSAGLRRARETAFFARHAHGPRPTTLGSA